MSLDASKALVKPVYNVGDYGEDLAIPLGEMDTSKTIQTFTISTTGQIKNLMNDDVEDIESVISDTDTGVIMHEGNSVDFDQIYKWLPDMSAFVYKTNIILGIGMNVSAYTNGNCAVNTIQVIIKETLQDGTVKQNLLDVTKAMAMTNMTATGSHIAIVNIETNNPYRVTSGNVIEIRIIVTRTQSGTATTQTGIIPLFPFIKNAVAKTFVKSQMKFHLHASLDHMYPVFRSQDNESLLDYSGINKDRQFNGVISNV